MIAYIIRRLLLIFPTLFGILLLNFVIVQAAPGGPVEQTIAHLTGMETGAGNRMGSNTDSAATQQSGQIASASSSGLKYRGSEGLNPELIKRIEAQYGFDKPATERFWLMLKNYMRFNLGESFYRDASVTELIKEKLPVSISLGLWSTLLVYLISIPIGIRKAIKDGSAFDVWTSVGIIIAYAMPSFLFAIFLIFIFAGGNYLDWFPLRGLTSNNFDELSLGGKVLDYLWHITLPVTALTVGSFATLTMLTKNSFLDEIKKHYVITARAKGLTEKQVMYGHVFRNAMLIIIAGFPAALVGIFFTGSMLIEIIFSLDGLGLLGFEAVLNRDYPVVFGTLFFFTLISLTFKLISDLTYVLVDPRIDFNTREN